MTMELSELEKYENRKPTECFWYGFNTGVAVALLLLSFVSFVLVIM